MHQRRVVLLLAGVWRELSALRGSAGQDDPAFRSARGGHLDPSRHCQLGRLRGVFDDATVVR
jgi:hypothetical protein